MPSLTDLITGNQISAFLAGDQSNPAYQQAQIQLQNQPLINTEAWNAYRSMMGGAPQQQVAAMDPTRMGGLQGILGAMPGLIGLAQGGSNVLGSLGGGAGIGSNTLQNIAMGGVGPQFNQNVAGAYQNFMQPALQAGQQALANQANMAWNKGVGNLGGVGEGFMSSGRNAALAQAQENAMTNLASQQQMLAFNAAQQAAMAGQQAGGQQFAGQLGAAGTLGQQGLGAAGLTGQLQQASMMPFQAQVGVGEQLQNQQQALLNAQYNNALAQFQNPFKSLQNLQAGLGTLGSTTGALNRPMPNNLLMLMNLLGQGMSGSGTFGPLLQSLGGGLKDLFKGESTPLVGPAPVINPETGVPVGRSTIDDWSNWGL